MADTRDPIPGLRDRCRQVAEMEERMMEEGLRISEGTETDTNKGVRWLMQIASDIQQGNIGFVSIDAKRDVSLKPPFPRQEFKEYEVSRELTITIHLIFAKL